MKTFYLGWGGVGTVKQVHAQTLIKAKIKFATVDCCNPLLVLDRIHHYRSKPSFIADIIV